MTKLITETPDQPIPFLIDHLQSKQENRGHLQRTLSGSAALWAESETLGKWKIYFTVNVNAFKLKFTKVFLFIMSKSRWLPRVSRIHRRLHLYAKICQKIFLNLSILLCISFKIWASLYSVWIEIRFRFAWKAFISYEWKLIILNLSFFLTSYLFMKNLN